MKKQNRICILLLALALLAATLAGCQTAGTESEPTEPAMLEGFERCESDGITFQIPQEWVAVGGGENLDEDAIAYAIEATGIDEATLRSTLSSVTEMFIDTENSSETFSVNLNLVVTASSGMTQKSLLTERTIDTMTEEFSSLYSTYFTDFKWITPVQAQTFGENELLILCTGYSLAGMNIAAYQAMIVDGSTMYTFTYTAPQEVMDASVVESILSTIWFN